MIRSTAFVAALLVIGLASASAHPVPRTVLLEAFTNVSCAGCADANAATAQVVDALGPTRVLNVQIHLNWPESTDPFYVANPSDNFVRTLYNGIASAPDLVSNGENAPAPGSVDALTTALAVHRDRLSPLELSVSHTLVGQELSATVTVRAVDDPPSDELTLHLAVIDAEETFATPPGSNGETEFHDTLRGLIPDFNGTAFTIAADDSLVFELSATLDAAWLDDDLDLVAWVQDDLTHEVWQAAGTAAAPAYAADYYAERYGAVEAVDVLHTFEGWLANRGTSTDTYDIHLEADTPGWEVSACIGTSCYPSWITDFTATLAPGEEIVVAVDVKALTAAASGHVTLTCSSRGDGDVSISRTFTLISAGADVLVVDADSSGVCGPYFTDALDDLAVSRSLWDRTAFGVPASTDLAAFAQVVWNAEGTARGLDASDRDALGTYLDDGGDLMLSGQDVAYTLCSTQSPHRTYSTQVWYEHYTGAVFQADDAQDGSIVGVTDDPVGDGLSFLLFGGDGAGNQDYPDLLSPVSNARACLEYAADEAAAVRFARGDARMVTLGFGFEGIGAATQRTALMAAALAWFADQSVDAPDTPSTLGLGGIAARPNPFNPATDLVFALDGAGTIATRVELYDLLGRRVRRLHDGPLAAGRHALRWDGRDDAGAPVAGGIYLARVRAGETVRTLKLSLVK